MTMRPANAATSPAPLASAAAVPDALPWLPTLPWLLRARGAPASAQRLSAQLQASPDAGWRAAMPALQAAGLVVSVQRRPLAAVPAQWLPVALLLRSGDACVLTERRSLAGGQIECHLVLPGQDGDEVFCASAAELAAEYTGQLLVLQASPMRAAAQAADGSVAVATSAVVTPLRSVKPLRSAVPPSALPLLEELITTNDPGAVDMSAVDALAAAGLPGGAGDAAVADVPAAASPPAVVLALPNAAAPAHAAGAPPAAARLAITLDDPLHDVLHSSAAGADGELPSWMQPVRAAGNSPLRRGGAGAWRSVAPAPAALPNWARLQGLKQAVATAAAGLRQGVHQFGQGRPPATEPAAAGASQTMVAPAAPPAPRHIDSDGELRHVEPVPAIAAAVAATPEPAMAAKVAVAAVAVPAVLAAPAVVAPAAPPAPVAPMPTKPAISGGGQAAALRQWWRRLALPAGGVNTPAAAHASARASLPEPALQEMPVLTDELARSHNLAQDLWPAGAATPISSRLQLGDDPRLWRHTAPAAATQVLTALPELTWPELWPVPPASPNPPAIEAAVTTDAVVPLAAPLAASPAAAGLPPDAQASHATAARARKPLRPLPRSAGRVPARTQWCAVPRPQRTATPI